MQNLVRKLKFNGDAEFLSKTEKISQKECLIETSGHRQRFFLYYLDKLEKDVFTAEEISNMLDSCEDVLFLLEKPDESILEKMSPKDLNMVYALTEALLAFEYEFPIIVYRAKTIKEKALKVPDLIPMILHKIHFNQKRNRDTLTSKRQEDITAKYAKALSIKASLYRNVNL